MVYYSAGHIRNRDSQMNNDPAGIAVYVGSSDLNIWCDNFTPIFEKEQPFYILAIGYIPKNI